MAKPTTKIPISSIILDEEISPRKGIDQKRVGIPQERIAKKLGLNQASIHNHLLKMPALANPVNSDLSMGFTVAQVAEKYGWTEPMVWSLALEGKEDLERFKELGWGLRTWDLWNWNDCLPREIHVNDSEAYFTGVTNVSVVVGSSSLTQKGNFSIIRPRKSKSLSTK